MLNFWYSERCTREIKLIVSICTCILIYLCSTAQQLQPTFVGIGLAIGISIHLLRILSLKITLKNLHQKGFQIILFVIPIMSSIILIMALPKQNQFFLALQCLGFIALGLFMVSIYIERSKR